MPIFSYVAVDPSTNKMFEGKIEAPSARVAKEAIREQGNIPTDLHEEHGGATVEGTFAQLASGNLTGPSLKDLTILTQQMSTLLDAGVPLIESLYLLEQQTTDKYLQKVLKEIRSSVIAGDSFSHSLSRYPKVFKPLYVNLIRAGEASGELEVICDRLATLMDKEITLRGKVQSALVMPAITTVVITLVTCGLLVFVVPQFEALFSQSGTELPLPTVMLLIASSFLTNYWWAMILGLGTLGSWFYMFANGKGKPMVDQWVLTIPLIGALLNKAYVSTFVRTLSTLVTSGVSLTEGLGIAANTVDNYILQLSFEKARDSILIGGTLSKPLEQSKAFPLMVAKMIAIGEETGNLQKMLDKSSDFLDREVEEAVRNLTEMIQPIMTVILGAILLFILLGLYMPIFDLHKTVGG